MRDMEKVNETPNSHLIYPHRYPSMRSKKPRNCPILNEKERYEVLGEGSGIIGPIIRYLDQRVTQVDSEPLQVFLSLRIEVSICLTSTNQPDPSLNTDTRLLLITTTKSCSKTVLQSHS